MNSNTKVGRKPGEFNKLLDQIINSKEKSISKNKFKDDRSGKLVRALYPLAQKIFGLQEPLSGKKARPATKMVEKRYKDQIKSVPNSWKILYDSYRSCPNWEDKFESDLEISYKPGEIPKEDLYERMLKLMFSYLENQKVKKGAKNKENAKAESKKNAFGEEDKQNNLLINQENSCPSRSFDDYLPANFDYDPDFDFYFGSNMGEEQYRKQFKNQNELVR